VVAAPSVFPGLFKTTQSQLTWQNDIDTQFGVLLAGVEQLKQKYPTGELYLTKSQATFFEATNPIANKGTAVQHLAETILGFDRSEVMTVGDNMNDVEMIEYAGIGVAMGNAPQALQDLANWVAPDVDHDGAAVAIAKFVLT